MEKERERNEARANAGTIYPGHTDALSEKEWNAYCAALLLHRGRQLRRLYRRSRTSASSARRSSVVIYFQTRINVVQTTDSGWPFERARRKSTTSRETSAAAHVSARSSTPEHQPDPDRPARPDHRLLQLALLACSTTVLYVALSGFR